MARIGVQAMMLKDAVAELGAFETLRRVVDIGYRVAEVSQIPLTPATVDELVKARDELGFAFSSTSAALAPGGANDSLEDSFDKIVSDARRLGADMVRIGMLPVPALRSMEAVLDFCARADTAARRLADEGIRLYYHNHHVEFAKHEGRYLLDVIAENSPNVGLELDAHWIARGGLDPARVIDQHAGRVRMVHLKDYRIGWPSAAAIDAHAAGEMDAWKAAWLGVVQFAEVGEGNLDWSSIIETSLRSGAEYLLVEQDELYGRTVWESLRISHDNLHRYGYGELF
ncbi:sugar phosphate isomerase/epimerase [Pseudonocardia sp. MH-G8]|uniref:sugar phosphate isomerase/epimerase family protein n=1 Tax=Pseudonocardia sp. MH-G8 TaxID=1854588 RepID=UPI000BA1396F|nr:sugar phosphate isomerase/epimerase [Pseudonocardia sp. MH-G8]OZM75385.1 sugar phosphate isomerase [Pseudonocardia sp. MH-G8]